MRKLLRVFCGVGLFLLHSGGIILIEAFCATLIIDHYRTEISYELLIILVVACILTFHYMLLRAALFRGVLSKAIVIMLAMVEFIIAIVVVVMLLFPSHFYLGPPEHFEYAFIIGVNLLMMIIRVFNTFYLYKKL